MLLRTFSDEEMERFSDFAASPYFNTNNSVLRLVKELRKCHPDFPPERVSKEKLYGKLFSGEKYNDQVMRNLSSQLLKLAKEFLSIEKYNRDEIAKSLGSLEEIKSRRLDSIFNSDYKAISSILSGQKLDEDLFHKMHKLEDMKVFFLLSRDKQKEVYESLAKSGNYLIYYFLIRLSDIYINMKINQDALNEDMGDEFVKEFFEDLNFKKLIGFLESYDVEYGNIFTLYYYRMMCMLYPDDSENFFKLKELVMKNISGLRDVEIAQLMRTLEFVATYQINRGEREFYKELFNLVNLEMRNGFGQYTQGHIITALKFRNTVLVALRLGEIDWAHNYVLERRERLNEESQEVADLTLGMVYFEKGEFEKAIEAVSAIKTEYSLVKVDIKYLLIKSFYELGYDESVVSQLNSFRHLIGTHKQITDITREKGLNFINLAGALVKLKSSPEEDKLKELLEKTNSMNLTSDKTWLEKKVKDILNKRTAV